jgi:lipopolysaccharide transport system ATP-binding protein
VGDAAFANRCVRKFEQLRERRVTVLFVSHDLGLVKQLSSRAILLLNGRIGAEGTPHDVVNRYIGAVLERQAAPARDGTITAPFRHGDGTSEIRIVEVLDSEGRQAAAVASGDPITVRAAVRVHRACAGIMAGIMIRTRTGVEVYGTNTRIEETALGPFEAGDEFAVEFRFACWLTPQTYTITVATQHEDGTSHDWLDDVATLEVVSRRASAGLVDLRAEIQWRALQ